MRLKKNLLVALLSGLLILNHGVTSDGFARDVTVGKGMSLSYILDKQGVGQQELQKVYKFLGGQKHLPVLQIGAKVKIKADQNRKLKMLAMVYDGKYQTLYKEDETGDKVPSEKTLKIYSKVYSIVIKTEKESFKKTCNTNGLMPDEIDVLGHLIHQQGKYDPNQLPHGTSLTVYFSMQGDAGIGDRMEGVDMLLPYGKVKSWTLFSDEDGQMQFFPKSGQIAIFDFLDYPLKSFRISSPYSLKRLHPITKQIKPHYGIDLATPEGSLVYAAEKGKVIHMGDKGGYGKTVIIEHAHDFKTLYAHLSAYSEGLKEGSVVEKSEVIAKVGKTGKATGPHLHYEVRRGNVPQDPEHKNFRLIKNIAPDQMEAFLQKHRAIRKS